MNRIIKISKDSPEKGVIQRAVDILNNKGVLIYPTETSYGIGCSIVYPESIKRIYDIKRRPGDMPLPVIMADMNMIRKYVAGIPETAERLIKRYMPGPLTLVLQAKDNVPNGVKGPGGGIAFRISSSLICGKLVGSLGVPLISTSANLSGQKEVRNIRQLPEDIIKQLDLVLDSGELYSKNVSTIMEVKQDDSYTVLREGEIAIDKIKDFIKNE